MQPTNIEWVKNPDGTQGYTWNPITGCLGPNGTPEKPNRCSYCYAHKLAKGRLKERYLSIPEYPDDLTPSLRIPHTDKVDPFVPRYWRHRLKEPFWHRKSCTIFVCSMADLFNKYYPASCFGNILKTCYKCPQHTFLVLTKNPAQEECTSLPRNVWLGTTITGEESEEEQITRLERLMDVKASIHFVSFEPLLGPIAEEVLDHIADGWLDWVIVGEQTQPRKIPLWEWGDDIIRAKEQSPGTALFMKKNLTRLGKTLLTQEFPKDK